MAESVLRGSIQFFEQIGIFDVVLPFLLVFTIVYAILDKTRIFGTEKWGDKEIPKKNLNAMTAFVIAFFAVATTQIVAIISQAMAHVVILLMLMISYMLLVGVFQKDEEFYLEGGWAKFFMAFMAVGIFLIFLNAVGWLEAAYDFVVRTGNSTTVATIILIIFIVLFMVFVTRSPKDKKDKKKEDK